MKHLSQRCYRDSSVHRTTPDFIAATQIFCRNFFLRMVLALAAVTREPPFLYDFSPQIVLVIATYRDGRIFVFGTKYMDLTGMLDINLIKCYFSCTLPARSRYFGTRKMPKYPHKYVLMGAIEGSVMGLPMAWQIALGIGQIHLITFPTTIWTRNYF